MNFTKNEFSGLKTLNLLNEDPARQRDARKHRFIPEPSLPVDSVVVLRRFAFAEDHRLLRQSAPSESDQLLIDVGVEVFQLLPALVRLVQPVDKLHESLLAVFGIHLRVLSH